MKVDKTLVDKLANLSKLEFDEKEQDAIIKNLSDMLDFVGKLDEVDVEGIAPLIYMNSDTNVMRPDEPHMEITKEEALKMLPWQTAIILKFQKL